MVVPEESEVAAVMGLLWRMNNELEILSKRMMRVHGVTGPQRTVLRIIARESGASAGRIAEVARIHPSTLTGILERLVRGGFAVRTRDLNDGRRACFELTAAGQSVSEIQAGTVESAVVASLADLPGNERNVARRWLAGFGEALARQRDGLSGSEDAE